MHSENVYRRFANAFSSGRPRRYDTAEIQEYSSNLGVNFNEPYREFLRDAGTFSCKGLIKIARLSCFELPVIDVFISLDELAGVRSTYIAAGMPSDLIVFALDWTGDALCFRADGHGDVLLFDHDLLSVNLLADSLRTLLTCYISHST